MKFSTASIKVALILAIVMFFSVTFLALAQVHAHVNGLEMGDSLKDLERMGIECTRATSTPHFYRLSEVPIPVPGDPVDSYAAIIHPKYGLMMVAHFIFDIETAANGEAIRSAFRTIVQGISDKLGYFELDSTLPNYDVVEASGKPWMHYMSTPGAELKAYFTDSSAPEWPKDVIFASVSVHCTEMSRAGIIVRYGFRNFHFYEENEK